MQKLVARRHLRALMDMQRNLAQAPPSQREVERTILFSDVVASTEIICREGNRRWLRLLATHRNTMRAVVRRHQGQIVNFAGDGFIAVFTDPALGVDCALRLQEAFAAQGQLDVRIGVHHGWVLPFDDGTYVGLAMHLAARFTDLSGAGEMVVSESCYQAARPRTTLPELELHHAIVRGVDEPQAVRFSRRIEGPWVA